MPSVDNNLRSPGMGTYTNPSSTSSAPDPGINPASTIATGQVPDVQMVPVDNASSPVSNLVSGIGGVLLFPGRVLVQSFVGAGDPLDMSHLPVTILLSLGAWYGLYWYLASGPFKKKGAE